MAVIEETTRIAGFLKATKKNLAIGKKRMYGITEEQSNVTRNLYEIIKEEEQLYIRQYASDVSQWGTM